MTDLERIDGLYVGQLTESELRMFERAVKDGEAIRVWNPGRPGVAKVKIVRVGVSH